MKQLENLIIKRIRGIYTKRLITPIIYILLLAALWFFGPVGGYVFAGEADTLHDATKGARGACVNITLRDLRFTGYTQTRFSFTSGYYYYAIEDGQVFIVLLSPRTCEQGVSSIDELRVRTVARPLPDNLTMLYDGIATRLDWTSEGLMEAIYPQMLSQPAASTIADTIFIVFYGITGLIAIISLINYVIYLIAPIFSPTGRLLGLYGKRKELMDKATEELATLPQLATEDIYITESFFIAFTPKSVTVLPISEIVWVYKHSTLHKFLWYHFSISYTLHLVANKHIYVQLPKNMKSDIDGIIDYLSEANHEILIGFDEKNRKMVQKTLGFNRFWGIFLAFMNQRV